MFVDVRKGYCYECLSRGSAQGVITMHNEDNDQWLLAGSAILVLYNKLVYKQRATEIVDVVGGCLHEASGSADGAAEFEPTFKPTCKRQPVPLATSPSSSFSSLSHHSPSLNCPPPQLPVPNSNITRIPQFRTTSIKASLSRPDR